MRRVVPLLALVLAAVSCGDDGPGTGATPSTAGSLKATTGNATLEVSGPSRQTFSLRIDTVRTSLTPPPGPFKSVWLDANETTVALAGAGFTGTKATTITGDQALIVSIGFTDGATKKGFTSTRGDCTVSMTEATATKIKGSFTCEKISPLTGGGGPYRLSGTFVAEA